MKKIIAIALMSLTLAGCGGVTEKFGTINESNFSIVCLNGVEYYYRRTIGSSAGYLAVKYNTDSTVSLCK